MSATALIQIHLVFLLCGCRYQYLHRKGQYTISGQTVLDNQCTTYEHPVKNEAYVAQSSGIAEESSCTVAVGFEEKGAFLEKDE